MFLVNPKPITILGKEVIAGLKVEVGGCDLIGVIAVVEVCDVVIDLMGINALVEVEVSIAVKVFDVVSIGV